MTQTHFAWEGNRRKTKISQSDLTNLLSSSLQLPTRHPKITRKCVLCFIFSSMEMWCYDTIAILFFSDLNQRSDTEKSRFTTHYGRQQHQAQEGTGSFFLFVLRIQLNSSLEIFTHLPNRAALKSFPFCFLENESYPGEFFRKYLQKITSIKKNRVCEIKNGEGEEKQKINSFLGKSCDLFLFYCSRSSLRIYIKSILDYFIQFHTAICKNSIFYSTIRYDIYDTNSVSLETDVSR